MRKPRDRRQWHKCLVCKASFMGEKGKPGAPKWCLEHRLVAINCAICKKQFSVGRNTYIFRGAKFCSLTCSQQQTLITSERIAGVKHPRWKGGLNSVKMRKARLKGATGFYTENEWLELKKKYNFMCLCCKQKEPFIKLERDHIMPLSQGGQNNISNIQPLCKSCNRQKYTKFINYIELWNTISPSVL